jgi:predicted ABC-type ATPase
VRSPALLLVVTGPPGAGKSAVGKALAARFESSVLVEGDAFFAFVFRGAIPPWVPESREQNEIVTRAAASAAGQYVSGGYVTVYDGVVGAWFLPTFAAATGLDSLHYVVLLPSVERCVDRVQTRIGHGFADEAATRKMHDAFEAADIDERYVLVDPPDGVAAVTDTILARVDDGTLLYRKPRPG